MKVEIYIYYVLKSIAKVLGRQEVIGFKVQAIWRWWVGLTKEVFHE